MSAAASRKVIRLRFRKPMNRAQQLAWNSENRWTLFAGGWGAGKTWCGARAFLRNVMANPPGVDSLLFAPFWSTVERTTLREFLSMVPKGMITGRSKRERYVEVVGRRVYYGSADRPETLDGPTVGAVWGDEVRYVDRQGWQVAMSRLRSRRARQLRGFLTSTPGGDWLQEEFTTGKAGHFAVHASTRENEANLDAGYVDSLAASLSARAARVYIDGHFGLVEGAVYEFDRGRHLIPWTHRGDLPVVVAWDFGWQRPSVLFLQPVPAGTVLPPARGTTRLRAALPGTWVVFDEISLDELSTEALAVKVKQKGYRVSKIYCDPAGNGTQTATGLSDVKLLRAAGFQDVRWVDTAWLRVIPTGVRMVEAMLGNVKGETRLFVAEQLDRPEAKRGIVKDFGGYRYPKRKDGQAMSDQPLKDGLHDHSTDALRYFVLNEAQASGTAIESRQVR